MPPLKSRRSSTALTSPTSSSFFVKSIGRIKRLAKGKKKKNKSDDKKKNGKGGKQAHLSSTSLEKDDASVSLLSEVESTKMDLTIDYIHKNQPNTIDENIAENTTEYKPKQDRVQNKPKAYAGNGKENPSVAPNGIYVNFSEESNNTNGVSMELTGYENLSNKVDIITNEEVSDKDAEEKMKKMLVNDEMDMPTEVNSKPNEVQRKVADEVMKDIGHEDECATNKYEMIKDKVVEEKENFSNDHESTNNEEEEKPKQMAKKYEVKVGPHEEDGAVLGKSEEYIYEVNETRSNEGKKKGIEKNYIKPNCVETDILQEANLIPEAEEIVSSKTAPQDRLDTDKLLYESDEERPPQKKLNTVAIGSEISNKMLVDSRSTLSRTQSNPTLDGLIVVKKEILGDSGELFQDTPNTIDKESTKNNLSEDEKEDDTQSSNSEKNTLLESSSNEDLNEDTAISGTQNVTKNFNGIEKDKDFKNDGSTLHESNKTNGTAAPKDCNQDSLPYTDATDSKDNIYKTNSKRDNVTSYRYMLVFICIIIMSYFLNGFFRKDLNMQETHLQDTVIDKLQDMMTNEHLQPSHDDL